MSLSKPDPTNYFDVGHIKGDLKGRSVRGGAVTLSAQIIKFIITTGSTVVLARLLTPNDYGLVAMVTAVTGFVAIFKDLGLSMATIQRKDITHAQVSNLFWINFGISVALAVILCLISPLIAWFYHESRLTLITIALSSAFVFSGLSVQHYALLRRQMRFSTLGMIDIVSLFTGVAGAIILGWLGVQYWALVAMPILTSISNAIMVWVCCRWRPGFFSRGVGVRSMLAFGSHLTGFSVFNYFSRNLDNVLIGWYWGAQALGFYSRAYNIMMLPISQIRGPLESVSIPGMSHLQDDPIRYRNYYLKLVKILAFITMPLMVLLCVFAEEIITLLLGPKWTGCVRIFQILSVVSFIQPVSTTRGLVLISLGYSKKYLAYGVANSSVTVLSFVVGLPWGAEGVAMSYAITNYICLIPSLWYCFKGSSITIRGFLDAIFWPVVTSLFMGIGIGALKYYLPYSGIEITALLALVGIVVYLLSWYLNSKERFFISEIFQYRNFIASKKGKVTAT
jgi:O-antigen/teichoic acid export membrane protein